MIENAFGILTARWRILKTIMGFMPSNVEKIVKATVTLHNFIKLNDVTYCPPAMVDHYENGRLVSGLWRVEVEPLPSANLRASNFATSSAFQMRDNLSEYLFRNRIN